MLSQLQVQLEQHSTQLTEKESFHNQEKSKLISDLEALDKKCKELEAFLAHEKSQVAKVQTERDEVREELIRCQEKLHLRKSDAHNESIEEIEKQIGDFGVQLHRAQKQQEDLAGERQRQSKLLTEELVKHAEEEKT